MEKMKYRHKFSTLISLRAKAKFLTQGNLEPNSLDGVDPFKISSVEKFRDRKYGLTEEQKEAFEERHGRPISEEEAEFVRDYKERESLAINPEREPFYCIGTNPQREARLRELSDKLSKFN